MNKPKVLAIVGPTASGKSELALAVAERTGGEIISADSVQVYRGMDIGSAKPTPEEQSRVSHHMIDIVDPDEAYSVGQYQRDAKKAIASVLARGALPIVTGGSGLYVNAITHDLDLASRPEADPRLRAELAELPGDALYQRLKEADPEAAQRIHENNIVRVRRALEIALSGTSAPYAFDREQSEFDLSIIGISRPREKLYERIERRVEHMIERGLAGEVEALHQRFGSGPNAMQAIGYKEIVALLEGRLGSLDEAAELIKLNTRHFAKRQITWFKRDSRIAWMDAGSCSIGGILRHLEATK